MGVLVDLGFRPKKTGGGSDAKEQADLSLGTAKTSILLNQLDEVGPLGSVTFSGTPGVDRTRTVAANPFLTKGVMGPLIRGAVGAAGRLPQGAADFSQLPSAPTSLNLGSLPSVGALDRGGLPSVGALNVRGLPSVGSLDRGGLPSVGALNVRGLPSVGALNLGGLPSVRGFDPAALPSVDRGFDLSQLPDVTGAVDPARITAVEESIFRRGKRLLDPEFEATDRRLMQDLENRGIPLGSAAFEKEQTRLGRERTRALEDLSDRSIIGGQRERELLFDQALTGRQQGVGEILEGIGLSEAGRTEARGDLLTQIELGIGTRERALGERESEIGLQAEARERGFGERTTEFEAETLARERALGERESEIGFQAEARERGLDERATEFEAQTLARRQALTEMLLERGLPMIEIQSLLQTLQQVPIPGGGAVPTFGGTAGDITGAQKQITNAQFAAGSNLFDVTSGAIAGAFGVPPA